MRRLVIAAAGWLLVVTALLGVLWAFQRRLMYFPHADVPDPSGLGVTGMEQVAFETEDGIRLAGWFFPLSRPAPPTTIVVFNGNAGHRAYRVPLASALRQRGLQTLLFDYRGYGGNAGSPSESGLARDARAARAYLLGRRDVDPSRLVYFGESLGTGIAAGLAVTHPPSALILRSPFTSMADVGRHHYPWLPVGLLLRDRFATADRLRRLRVPVLVIAGGRDTIVPIESSRRVFEAAGGPKTLLEIPGADHNDDALFAGMEMLDAIETFLAQRR